MGRTCPESYYETGKRYNRLVVMYEQPREKRKRSNERELVCKCDCGKTISVAAYKLFSGYTKSCGCIRIGTHRKYEVIGKRFGKLVAVEELEAKNKKRRIRCKCDCGKETVVNLEWIVYKKMKSCGCYKKEILKKKTLENTEDITGMVFGELTAIKKVDSYIGKGGWSNTRWLFKCSCGRKTIENKSKVKSGRVVNCGHSGKSMAEYNITNWLIKHNITFEKEVSFPDLRNSDTDRRLLFDYKIIRNDGSFFLIEHQGIQHFIEAWGDFGKQQREQTDQMKKDYCKAKGITLYETLYNEDYISKLEEIIKKELGKDDAYEKGVKCG